MSTQVSVAEKNKRNRQRSITKNKNNVAFELDRINREKQRLEKQRLEKQRLEKQRLELSRVRRKRKKKST